MAQRDRLVRKGIIGRKVKLYSLQRRKHKSLGGIPMKLTKNTKKVAYKQKIPDNFSYCQDKEEYIDSESIEREYATLPEGEGSFIRRHIYEMRFDINNENNEERRKREYKEWIEKYI